MPCSHDAYVEGVPNREIMARMYVSEGHSTAPAVMRSAGWRVCWRRRAREAENNTNNADPNGFWDAFRVFFVIFNWVVIGSFFSFLWLWQFRRCDSWDYER